MCIKHFKVLLIKSNFFVFKTLCETKIEINTKYSYDMICYSLENKNSG